MSRRTLAITLFVSLALNLFLVGAVVGGLVVGQKFRHERPPMARGAQPLWTAADGLSPDQRRAYRAMLRGEAGEARAEAISARSARAEAWRGLAAGPLDAHAAKQGLRDARMREAQARARIEDRVVDFAANLSPADRARLAAALAEPRPKHRRGRTAGEYGQDRRPAP